MSLYKLLAPHVSLNCSPGVILLIYVCWSIPRYFQPFFCIEDILEIQETPYNWKDHQDAQVPSSGPSERLLDAPVSWEDPNFPPPHQLSPGAIDKRLRRVMAQRVDGSYKVPNSILDRYRDRQTRDEIVNMFEKVGYKADRKGVRGICFLLFGIGKLNELLNTKPSGLPSALFTTISIKIPGRLHQKGQPHPPTDF